MYKFAQHHIETLNYFKSINNEYTSIDIKSFPHFKYLIGDKDEFIKYLNISWKSRYNVSKNELNQLIKNHITQYDSIISNIKLNGINEKITITKRFNGDLLIVDGNHRTSISHYLNIELPNNLISIDSYLNKIILNSNIFYGSKKNNMPYQSIIYKGEEIIKGRRNDIINRAELIDINDIQNKNVLDFGCNYGMNSFYAHENGANKVVGIDIEPKILTSAIRIAVCFNYPIDFYTLNLSNNNIHSVSTDDFDTGFMFAIDSHVNNNDNLLQNIKLSKIKVLYFETHNNSKNPPKNIVNYFDEIKYLGETYKGRFLYKLKTE